VIARIEEINNPEMNRISSFNHKFHQFVHDLYGRSYPTAGGFGIALGLRLFKKVSLFGFAKAWHSGQYDQIWHYYDDIKNVEGPVIEFYKRINATWFNKSLVTSSPLNLSDTHSNIELEWNVYDQLEKQGILTHYANPLTNT